MWRFGIRTGDDSLMVKLAGNDWGLVNRDGRTQIVTDRLGPHFRAQLANPTFVWASAAEPSVFSGTGRPVALAISGDGTSLVDTVALGPDGAQLLARGDRGVVGLAPGDPPPPMSGFQTVYSRSMGVVFVVGGEDLVTHAPLGTVWRGDVDDAFWTVLPTSIAIDKALAATWSFSDRKLYAIDETVVAGKAVARLLRFDGATGRSELLGTWPRQHHFDQLWLVADRHGEILVVASSDAAKKHAVVRLDVTGDVPFVETVYKHPQPLAWPILVDANGYAVFQKKPNGTVLVQRLATLHDFGGGWAAVADLF